MKVNCRYMINHLKRAYSTLKHQRLDGMMDLQKPLSSQSLKDTEPSIYLKEIYKVSIAGMLASILSAILMIILLFANLKIGLIMIGPYIIINTGILLQTQETIKRIDEKYEVR